MTNLDTLARRMSEAERMRLLNADHGIKAPRYSRWAIEALCAKGWARAIAWSAHGVSEAVLTPKGEALRRHLLEKSNG